VQNVPGYHPICFRKYECGKGQTARKICSSTFILPAFNFPFLLLNFDLFGLEVITNNLARSQSLPFRKSAENGWKKFYSKWWEKFYPCSETVIFLSQFAKNIFEELLS
jgi:hypothetical protein